jgi:hypothetical protein
VTEFVLLLPGLCYTEKIKSLLKGAYLLESIGIYTNLKAFSKARRLDEGNSKGRRFLMPFSLYGLVNFRTQGAAINYIFLSLLIHLQRGNNLLYLVIK